MPHIITGQIRKPPYTKDGSGQKGPWRMYAVEMSESFKDRDGNRQYTNYRATVFATQNQMQYYDDAIQEGKVISFESEKLSVSQREHNGTNYITLELVDPRIVFMQLDSQPARSGGSGGWGQPQQPKQQQRPTAQQRPSAPVNNSEVNFDDDIPF